MLIYDGAAALVELPLLVYAVRYVGGRWEEFLALVQRFQGLLVPGILLLAVVVWLFSRSRSKNSGRGI
jgi:membrane protein DedA with SNARE-associated domain